MLAPSPRKPRRFDTHSLPRPKHPILFGLLFGALPIAAALAGMWILLAP